MHRKQRREKGLCAEWGCSVVTGDAYRCAEHAKAHVSRCMVRYWARKTKLSAANEGV